MTGIWCSAISCTIFWASTIRKTIRRSFVWKISTRCQIRTNLQATLTLFGLTIPFTFGFVSMYVNPRNDGIRMADKPDVVNELENMCGRAGFRSCTALPHTGAVTTDDYESGRLSDRPVRGDSEAFVTHRLSGGDQGSHQFRPLPGHLGTPHYALPTSTTGVHRFFERF